jgi:membrane-associated protease RseP (regulator of RpoE activity)
LKTTDAPDTQEKESMPSTVFRPADKPLLNLTLFVLTLGTTFGTFLLMWSGGGATTLSAVNGSLIFSLSLVLILGSHEMGHYILARIHKVDTSLPYFIPLPLLGVGTLGAVIRIRGRIPDRNALVDIGAAGPLAGLLVAIPLLAFGLSHSKIVDLPVEPPGFLGESSLWSLAHRGVEYLIAKWSGLRLPEMGAVRAEVYLFGDNLLIRALRYLVLGPIPAGKDIQEHPMVIAGWFGLLVTMLNLVPIGQLDGGHLTHALFGDRARTIGKLMALIMLGLCIFYSAGWLLWLIVTSKFIGFKHPPVVDNEAPLSRGRKLTCAICFVGLLLCVIPVPLSVVAVP